VLKNSNREQSNDVLQLKQFPEVQNQAQTKNLENKIAMFCAQQSHTPGNTIKFP